MERMSANGVFFHRTCFRCSHCNCQLRVGGYSFSKGDVGSKGKFFCDTHYQQLFLSNPKAINYSRVGATTKDRAEHLVEVVKPVEPVSRLDEVVKIDEQKTEKRKGEGEGKREKETSETVKKQREVKSTVELVRLWERKGRANAKLYSTLLSIATPEVCPETQRQLREKKKRKRLRWVSSSWQYTCIRYIVCVSLLILCYCWHL